MTILQMSLSGAVIIAVILLLRRALLYRLPKWTFLLLWGVALCRLLIPFTIPSPVSIYTGAAQVVQGFRPAEEAPAPLRPEPAAPMVTAPAPGPVASSGAFQEDGWTPLITEPTIPAEPAVPATEETSCSPLAALYGVGTALCVLFFAAAYGWNLHRFRDAEPVEQDITGRWQEEHPTLFPVQIKTCAAVSAPLTCGLLRPVVLLPENTDWGDEHHLTYILTHEYVHIRRGDLFWKLLLTAALCIHWFNPLVWCMYFCANRDLELACDEAVVRILGLNNRKNYAYALLSAAESGFTPLCLTYTTKNHMEERITAIMKTKKQTTAALAAAVLLVTGVAAVFATAGTPSAPKESAPQVWIDYEEDQIPWGTSQELELDQFPGAVFTWTPDRVTVREEEGSRELFWGMPVSNVFLLDLTGDGLPELCATVGFGYGLVDHHVLAYDYAAGEQYTLWDRGFYDYVLSLEEGRLTVTRTGVRDGSAAIGSLALGSYNKIELTDVEVVVPAVRTEPLAGEPDEQDIGTWDSSGIVFGYSLYRDQIYMMDLTGTPAVIDWWKTMPNHIMTPVYDESRKNVVGYTELHNLHGYPQEGDFEEELAIITEEIKKLGATQEQIDWELDHRRENRHESEVRNQMVAQGCTEEEIQEESRRMIKEYSAIRQPGMEKAPIVQPANDASTLAPFPEPARYVETDRWGIPADPVPANMAIQAGDRRELGELLKYLYHKRGLEENDVFWCSLSDGSYAVVLMPSEDQSGLAGAVGERVHPITDTPNQEMGDGGVHPVAGVPVQGAVSPLENRWGVPDGEIPYLTEFTVDSFEDGAELGKYLEAAHGLYPGDYVSGRVDGVRYIVQVTYQEREIRERLPDGVYPVNSRGETYGSAIDAGVVGYEPDLISVITTDGIIGYVLRAELRDSGYPGGINSPEDALAYMEWRKNQPSPRTIPVYDADRNEVVGYFEIG